MKTILFVRGHKAYLPEIAAYMRFLEGAYPGVKAYDSYDLKDYDLMDFDVVWRFMGVDVTGRGRYIVHEYNSLSAGAAPHFKNLMKKTLNKRPDRRVFLNNIVRQGFSFKDGVPDGLRDMGVAPGFFETHPSPEYDFVYVGSIHRGREVLRMLEHFSSNLRESSILVVGSTNADVLKRYQYNKNIIFSGPVPYEDVPALMAKGRFGLNLIPDRYPFNLQTATKVLEYCALGLKLVTMRYHWIEDFMQQKDGRVFWLDSDFSNLTIKNLESHDFQIPDMHDRRWDRIISDSGIFDFLKSF